MARKSRSDDRKFMKNIEPVEEDDRERLNEMGPAPESGIYYKTRTEDFTEYWRHGSQTSKIKKLCIKI
jgi:hypothetical protein